MSEENKPIKGFKGFDKDLKCRDYQYEIGGEYSMEGTPKACKKGFHFCENPLDVFEYYKPGESRYAEVEGYGSASRDGGDSKVAVTKIKIGAEWSFKSLFQAGFKMIFEKIKSLPETTNTSGYSSHANTSGDSSHANTSGDSSHANTSGDSSHANTSGYRSHANTSGYRSHANTSGDRSHAEVTGADSIAAAFGIDNSAKGALGCWLVLSEWERDENYKWHIKVVKSIRVDGKRIKAEVSYKLINGKITKA